MATIYGDRWEVVESLGAGGQAEVFRVVDRKTRSGGWVLKRLRNLGRLDRFESEIAALNKLNHPRIPHVEDYGLGEKPYFVSEEIPGRTLDKVVATEGLTVDIALDLVRDVVEAAAAAHHAGVAHRDIKPNNVVITEEQPHRRAWLIDFGLAQHEDGQFVDLTSGEALGNSAFAAPEAAAGSEEATGPPSDVYSLGKLLYYAVSNGGTIARENVTQAVLSRIPEPRLVERSYIRRMLNRTITEDRERRISASSLQSLIERDAVIMRLGVSRMGANDQTCPICRQGRMDPITDIYQSKIMGFERFNDPSDYRSLRCDFCGWVQGHFIKDTRGRNEWEF